MVVLITTCEILFKWLAKVVIESVVQKQFEPYFRF